VKVVEKDSGVVTAGVEAACMLEPKERAGVRQI